MSVREFYNGKSVFLTGGTGFLGINLIEKLLRSCPDLENIYLLIRPKKGKLIKERLEELMSNLIFHKVNNETKESYVKKLIIVAGDVSTDNLGLSEEDRKKIIENVEIVIHCAATLDFHADLKTNINVNFLGTRRIIQFCHEIKNLKAYIHVSSAYVNTMELDIDEKIYPISVDVNEVLKMVEELSNEELEEEKSQLLRNHTNSYTFSKHLAEYEVVNASLPSAIIRPSIIVGSWKQPEPGWIMSKNGPTGFIMGIGMGIIRALPLPREVICDYIPVDVVSNTILTAACAINRDGGTDVKVYHCTTSTSNPFRWKLMDPKLLTYIRKRPLLKAIWYPEVKMLNSIFLFKFYAFFVHIIPALVLDSLRYLNGKRPILLRMHRKINKSLNSLEKFIFTEWKFHNPNYMSLSNSLTKEDEEDFFLDIETLDWDDFFEHMVIGCRRYLHNETNETIEKARLKQKRLLIAHVALKIVLAGFIWWFLKLIFNTTWIGISIVLPFIYLLFNIF